MDYRPDHERLRVEREARANARRASMTPREKRTERLKGLVGFLVAIVVLLLAHYVGFWVWLAYGVLLLGLHRGPPLTTRLIAALRQYVTAHQDLKVAMAPVSQKW